MKKTAETSNASFLTDQRTSLERLRAHLIRRTRSVDRDLGREGVLPETNLEEQAVIRENDEVLEALSNEGREQLPLVEDALARLDAGTYGSCEVCKKAIALTRLEARPYATTCIACSTKETP